jgi:hypothetical protein
MRTFRVLLAMLTFLVAARLTAAADPPRVVVRDAGGELVGIVLGQAADTAARYGLVDEAMLWVATPIDGTSILLLVGRNELWATKDLVPFLYESGDCSGPALLDAPPEADGVGAALVFDTSVFWPAGPGASRVIRSRGTPVLEPAACTDALVGPQLCCATVKGGETHFTAQVTGLEVAKLHLRMPLRIEQETGPPK